MLSKIQKVFGLSFLVLLFNSTVIANNNENEQLAKVNVPMVEIGHLLETTLPLIYETEKFQDPKNKQLIEARLTELKALFKQAEPHLAKKSLTFKISSDILIDQINNAEKAFKNDQYDLAQQQLKVLPRVCMSCHIQDKKEHRLFHRVKSESLKSEFSKAEFDFITRDYKAALKHYDNFLKVKHDKSMEPNINTALERILVIHTQIYKNPEEVYKKLKAYQKLTHLPKEAKYNLSQWLEGLTEYIKQSGIAGNEIDYSKLDSYMSKHYNMTEAQPVPLLTSEKDKVFYVMLRGSLHEYLSLDPKPNEIPILLYWLAICDRTLEYNFYYSLADVYLKECINSFSKHKFAKKCYQAYEDYLKFSFTGSGGLGLPYDVEEELKVLKSRLSS